MHIQSKSILFDFILFLFSCIKIFFNDIFSSIRLFQTFYHLYRTRKFHRTYHFTSYPFVAASFTSDFFTAELFAAHWTFPQNINNTNNLLIIIFYILIYNNTKIMSFQTPSPYILHAFVLIDTLWVIKHQF